MTPLHDSVPAPFSGFAARPTDRGPAIRFPCPTCGRRIRVTADAGGRTATCPECGERLRVPDFAGVGGDDAPLAAEGESPVKPAAKKRKRRANGLPPIVRKEPEEKPIEAPPAASPLDRMAEYRIEEPDPPPRFTFFSGVFDVPLVPGGMSRYLYLSVGLALLGMLGTFVLLLSGAMGGGFVGHGVAVGIAFLLLPTFWIGFFTCSYAAACCTAIVEHTAFGRRKVDQWPEPAWKDWAGDLIPLVYLLLPTGAIAAVVGQSVDPAWKWPAIVGTMILVYPFLWISALETGQVWVPFSPTVTWSLFPLWWAWLVFYVLTGLVTAGWVAAYTYGVFRLRAPFLTTLLTTPLLTYVLFVDARLLGRMAWKIGDRGR